ncbi:MAG: hypothetical protein FD171_672 [Actinobacteria bacterium]|nr:MAG: hypothetical protein FD171_672 [Actinomycetota bacterium]
MARQSDQDLRAHLRSEVTALLYASRGFDEGQLDPDAGAKLIGPRLRNLLHDTMESTSLLQHLGLKDTMRFFDSSCPRLGSGDVKMAHMALAGRTGSGRFLPHLDSQCESAELRRLLDFAAWWEQPVILDQSGFEFSRRQLVLETNNKDGCSHIDRRLQLTDEYAGLTRENSLGMFHGDGEHWFGYGSPVPASLRQIAHEVLVSVALFAPWAFKSKHQVARHRGIQQPATHPSDGIVISAMGVHVEPSSE